MSEAGDIFGEWLASQLPMTSVHHEHYVPPTRTPAPPAPQPPRSSLYAQMQFEIGLSEPYSWLDRHMGLR